MVSYTASKMIEIKKVKKIGESSVDELMASVEELASVEFEELTDSHPFETDVKKTQHILVFKFTCIDPWLVFANQTDILKILICK